MVNLNAILPQYFKSKTIITYMSIGFDTEMVFFSDFEEDYSHEEAMAT
jgi:hypothetical protein